MTEKDLKGIYGWLSFLSFGLIIGAPLYLYISYQLDIGQTEKFSPVSLKSVSWADFKTGYIMIATAACLLKIACGFSLLARHNKRSLYFVRISIWLFGPLTSVLLYLALPEVVFHVHTLSFMFLKLVGSLSVCIAWTLYLAKSQRVKNTFTEQACSTPTPLVSD